MKIRNLLAVLAILCFCTISAQDIVLPQPQHSGGMTLNEALNRRHSVRSFDASREVPIQLIADVLWAGTGINREEKGMRTNPTALNMQEIDTYLFTKTGVYQYNASTHSLKKMADGDHRTLVAGPQAFVLDAPISVVLIANTHKFKNPDGAVTMCAMDAGIVCQNINLQCTAIGLATVPRATMDKDGIRELLNLDKGHVPMLNNPIGYAK